MALITDAGAGRYLRSGLPVGSGLYSANSYRNLTGATAFVPALVNSGLPAHEFTFTGFLPQKAENPIEKNWLKKNAP